MKLKKWDDLPESYKNDKVKFYYDILKKRKLSLIFKRIFDIVLSSILLLLLSPVILILSIWIKLDSKGEIFFRQERVTQYGKIFRIFKFRTMVKDANKLGSQVTVSNDSRITKVGKFIRKVRLDEIPQLINVLLGDMTFVGTRPEVKKYVDNYTPEMLATLLLPAGITSEASINYKDEEKILTKNKNVDETYIKIILPEKMKYNLESIKKQSFLYDISIMFKTFIEVLR
ncbi:sugar transferase [Helcococcus ovis]|uniref:Sugar transferase n=3 Tax=Helcococcus ovis TaxID=72026 RepID=A0A4R9C4U7_9FIRM|nr:sugar transferase [Helcococcus ovis]TFF65107.1 sugar transferase [Helcococcus ovis]TFF66062.1 sugar transferase [Helcococcus ovis]TFF66751.1 sugar transferase [Helcococcus ovis]WNZ01525.1 sugar transferase [Helcococcus ovis]